MGLSRDNGRARVLEPAGPERVHGGRPEAALRGWEYPRFVHQVVEADLAPPRPGILSPSCNDARRVVKHLEIELLLREDIEPLHDEEIDVALAQLAN